MIKKWVRTNCSVLEVETRIDRRNGRTVTQVDQSYQTPFCSIASKKMRTLLTFNNLKSLRTNLAKLAQNICKHHTDRDNDVLVTQNLLIQSLCRS